MKNTFIIVLMVSTIANAQTVSILNGSFENNLYTACAINESNTSYSSSMFNSSAFGPHNTIDVIDSLCGYGTAQDSSWFLWLGTEYATNSFDAISMELNIPLTVGTEYIISYYHKSDSSAVVNGAGSEAIEIGLSNNDTTFGTLLHTSPIPNVGVWIQRSFNFVAVASEMFITVRAKPSNSPSGWGQIQIDNFSINSDVTGINENITINTIKLYPNPATEVINIELEEVNRHSKVQILNFNGQLILEKRFNNTENLVVNISELTNGVYIALVELEDMIVRQKFIKK